MAKKSIRTLNAFFILITFVAISLDSQADCQTWESGKYKASELDSDALDNTVKDAFKLQNVKNAQVSFNKCVFLVKPMLQAKVQTFDYSKDERKCNAIKVIFEMNLIGCEQTLTISPSTSQGTK